MKFNSLIPELSVSNIQASKHFYLEVLGFKLEYEREEDKFAFISYGEAQIMIEEINGYWNTDKLEHPFGRGINFQIGVQNVDIVNKRLIDNEIKLFREKKVNSYRVDNETVYEKEILVQDPDGYLLRFSEMTSEK